MCKGWVSVYLCKGTWGHLAERIWGARGASCLCDLWEEGMCVWVCACVYGVCTVDACACCQWARMFTARTLVTRQTPGPRTSHWGSVSASVHGRGCCLKGSCEDQVSHGCNSLDHCKCWGHGRGLYEVFWESGASSGCSWVVSAKAVCFCLLWAAELPLVGCRSQPTTGRKALSPVAPMAQRRIGTCPRTPSILEAAKG